MRIDLGIGRDLEVAVDTEHLPHRHLHVGQTGGRPGRFLHFGHGGGRHQSSEVPGAPETRFAVWLRMVAIWNLSESTRWQKPAARSKFRCVIIKIGAHPGFWKAALRITPHISPARFGLGQDSFLLWRFPCLIPSYARSAPESGGNSQHRNFVTSFIDSLIAFVSANAWLAYLTLFLAALLEAVPVVGSVIPGSTMILALSRLIPGGSVSLQWVLVAAIAGALLGDGTAFWIGHRTQREILSSWPMTNYPSVVAQSEAFFHRWGALAVFFARFVPPIRAFVPVTAGALGMPPLRFYPVNAAAILLWAPAHVLPGVLAVSALHHYSGLPHHAGIAKHIWILAVIVGALIVALATWTIRRRHGGAIESATEPVRKKAG